MPHLQTERLTFIPFTLDLVQTTIQQKADLLAKTGFDVHPSWPQIDFAEILPMIAGLLQQDASLSDWAGLIVHTADRLIIGDMGFKSAPDAQGAVEIGYSVVPEYQGQGLATEMARGLIEWAFAQPGVTKVLAECEADNIGSIRVLEKVGMQRIGQEASLLKWELQNW